MTNTESQIITVVTYAFLGAVYGASGYTKHVAEGEKEFRLPKFAKTLLIGAIAGAIVASQGGEFGAGAFEAAMVIAVPIADQLWMVGTKYAKNK